MASANDSLIDFSESATSSATITDTTPTVVTSQNTDSHSSVSAKPVRNVKISPLGIESKKNELAFSLYSSINKSLKAVSRIFKECKESVSLDNLEAGLTNIEERAEFVTSQYAKLSKLAENKVEKKVQTHFEFFVGEVNHFTDQISKQRQEIKDRDKADERENEELEKARGDLLRRQKLLEEEQQRFEDYMETRRKEREQEVLQQSMVQPTPLASGCSQQEVHIPSNSFESTPTTSPMTTPKVISTIPLRFDEPLSRVRDSEFNDRNITNVHASPYSATSDADSIRKLAQSLYRARKIEVEPAVFTGNPLELEDWECDLDNYFSSMGIDNGTEKIRFLKKYTSGDARECISGLLLIRTEESYNEARGKLKKRFGKQLDKARKMRAVLDSWQKIPANDFAALQKYADYLENCKHGMRSIPGLSILNDPQVNEKMAAALPEWMRRKWAEKVYTLEKKETRYPNFCEFSTFISELTEMQSMPLLQNQKSHETNSAGTSETRSVRGTKLLATSNNVHQTMVCLFCHKTHPTSDCWDLSERPYGQRIKFLQNQTLCYTCAEPFHSSSKCPKKNTVFCKKCTKTGHPTCLHKRREDWGHERMFQHSSQPALPATQQVPQKTVLPHSTQPLDTPPKPTDGPKQHESSDALHAPHTKLSNKNTRTPSQNRLFNMGLPVYVSTSNNPQNQVLVYALFDSASDHSYITKDLASKLKPKMLGRKPVEVETMVGEVIKDEVRIFGDMRLKGYYDGEVKLTSAYEWAHIPNSTGEFANDVNVLEYPHLEQLANAMPPLLDIPVGILLGANCSSAQFPLEAIKGKEHQPYALRSQLGWVVYGVEEGNRNRHKTHKMCLTEVDDGGHNMSQDDYKFMDIMENQTIITDTGSYQMPLPFRERPNLPDNREQAIKRNMGIYKRFESDDQFKAEYTSFMDELIDGGLAEAVDETMSCKTGEQWYIPHFAVRHPQKQKMRVVFDCKASYKGTSLNNHLLQGPDLMNSLLGILCRFRKESVALCCDIQKMFYNFLVEPADRDYLRFMWHNKDMQPQAYRMKVHLFGATSSPAVATYGLRKIAKDNRAICTKAEAFIKEDFYVDDGVTSVATVDEAIMLAKAAKAICSKGNLRLHKFSSNSTEVLASLPETERSVQDVDLFGESLPEQRTLGLQWAMDTDSFRFINKIQQKPTTRRGILSIVSQLYDPLGFIAPYTLIGKNILQQVNQANKGWDEQIPSDISIQWNKWTEQLPALERIKIPRCLQPQSFGNIVTRELHHFCDASEKGMGACSYLRQINSEGRVHVAFLLGKSKVVPSKGLFTIPRLELVSAVMATELSAKLHKEMNMTFDNEYFWSDSKIVLGWIGNNSKRFSTFVHNRIRLITARSKLTQWYHVPGHLNPADLASRGEQCDQLSDSMWLTGPAFLSDSNNKLLEETENFQQFQDLQDVEVKKTKTLLSANNKPAALIDIFVKYSTWSTLKRSIAILQQAAASKSWSMKPLTTEKLLKAETTVITNVQQHHFREEYYQLSKGMLVNKSSVLFKLNPFIDSDGVLRVGGRAQESRVLGFGEKHPILLPKDEHVSSLIAQHYHNLTHHQGRTLTIGAIRSHGYWILGVTRMVKSMLHRCITCNRLRGKPTIQIMSELPSDRLEPTPPFASVGMDCFGPFVVKDRRSEVKRWGLLLTCLYSRAVHVELLEDMSTDSLINALRCFMCLRGTVKRIYCDQGTNFVGASNELQKELQSMDSSSLLTKFLKDKQIEFVFNAPHASHAGGVWERQIRSIRAVLGGMASGKFNNRLSTSGLRTAFYEAMSTVNSRPIAVSSMTDPKSPILTPNHLLSSKPTNITSLPGNFDTTEVYGRKMWRKVQQFADEFWKAWKGDYLTEITKRQKWERPQRNMQKGDIVLLMEDNTPRNQWPYGMIEETNAGSDGKVRRVKVKMANAGLDNRGKTMYQTPTLERPVQKLVVLQKSEDNVA